MEEHLRLQMQRRTCAGQAAATGPRESVYSSNTVTRGPPSAMVPGMRYLDGKTEALGEDREEGRGEKRGEGEHF